MRIMKKTFYFSPFVIFAIIILFGLSFNFSFSNGNHTPDLKIKTAAESSYTGDNIYSSDPQVQSKSGYAYAGESFTFHIALEDDYTATTSDVTYVLKGTGGVTACIRFPCWTTDLIRYKTGLSGGSDITDQIQSADGLSQTLSVGETRYYRVEVTIPASFTEVTTHSFYLNVYQNGELRDSIGFLISSLGTQPGPVSYRIDALIREESSLGLVGNDIYNENAENQKVSSVVEPKNKGVYFIELQNETNNSAASAVVKSEPIIYCLITPCNQPVKFYYLYGDWIDISDAVFSSEGWVSPLIPLQGSLYLKAEVDVSQLKSVTFLLKTYPYYDENKKDSVSATTELLRYQPDLLAKNYSAEEYIGDNIYSENGLDQEVSQSIEPGEKAIFNIKIENDGNKNDSFVLKGTNIACLRAPCWAAKYLDKENNDITDLVTGVNGSSTSILLPKEFSEMKVELIPDLDVVLGNSMSVFIEAVSESTTNETKEKDIIKLTAILIARRGPLPSNYQPDGVIISGFFNIGEDIYNSDAENQVVIRTATKKSNAVFELMIQNDGLTEDSFIVKTSPDRICVIADETCWSTKVTDSKGIDITSDITSSRGYKTSVIASKDSINLKFEMSPLVIGAAGSSFEKLVTIVSDGDNSKIDTVKLVGLTQGIPMPTPTPTPMPTTPVPSPIEFPGPPSTEVSPSPSLPISSGGGGVEISSPTPTGLVVVTPLSSETPIAIPSNLAPLIEKIENLPKPISKPIKIALTPKAQKINSTTAASIAVVNVLPLVATESAVSVWLKTIFDFILIKQRIIDFILFAPSIFLRRKRRRWGVVFDAITLRPISRAVVRLINSETYEQKDVTITDNFGRYSLIIDPTLLGKEDEKYIIKVEKKGYLFPSNIKIEYEGQISYYGGILSNRDIISGVLNLNIPLMPNTETKKQHLFISVFEAVTSFLRKITLPLTIIGLLFSAILTYFYPTAINIGILILYVLVLSVNLFITFKGFKSYAKIIDKSSKQPIAYATVRLFDALKSQLLATKVTTNDGKFNFLISPGKFYFTVSAFGYKTKISDVITLDKTSQIAGITIEMEKENLAGY